MVLQDKNQNQLGHNRMYYMGVYILQIPIHIVVLVIAQVTCTIPQAAQAHYMNADVTLACEWCCVTNGYL